MSLFKKKVDPISERARALSAEIAALEAKIQKLDGQIERNVTQPRLRSTAVPHRVAVASQPVAPPPQPSPSEPVFEDIDQNKLSPKTEITSPNHYNDLGVRKYDLLSLWRRIKNHFTPPPSTNPKLVSYLAAGSFQGLRPLRYEKRVARNRFILLVTILFLALLGILLVFLKNH